MGILTNFLNKNKIDCFIEDINSANSSYYFFAADVTPWPNNTLPPTAEPSVFETQLNLSQNLLFGKKLYANNVAYMAKRNNWQSGTVYSQYNHLDPNLQNKNFFVITNSNQVYKCLYNNKNANSTIQPVATLNTAFRSPVDGYVWKYMFTVDPVNMKNFSNQNYFPIIANSSIVSSANRSLEVMEVVVGGAGYVTYVTGSVQSVVNTSLIQIDNYASFDNDYYTKSSLYINSGPGHSIGGLNSISIIKQYTSNSTGNWVTLQNPLVGVMPYLSSYVISPTVSITGDGYGALAYSSLSNNSISAINILSTGQNYSHANVSIVCNTSYGVGANVIAYIPPLKGHGGDPVNELNSTIAGITITFANNENSTISTETTFSIYGLLKNPLNSNNNLVISNTFNQVSKFNINPQITYTVGDTIVGNTSGATGKVVFSNSSILMMSGDNNFIINEKITSLSSNVFSSISNVITLGDVIASSPSYLYINYISSIQRSNTETETINFNLEF